MTNVCNLACDNCNRYNNFAFAGHDRWADYADQYQLWSQRLNLIDIGIIGGEPMLNPDFLNWMHGVAKLWPFSYIKIITNGTQLDRWPTLYDELAQYQGRIVLYVTEHGGDRYQQTQDRLKNFLINPTADYRVYNDFLWRIRWSEIQQPEWPSCNTVQKFFDLPKHIQDACPLDPADFDLGPNTDPNSWQDQNGVRIVLTQTPTFQGSAVKYNRATSTLHLRNSRPRDAIKVCPFKICHHFIQGRLYKCGPVGILPEFIKQFPVQITKDERELLDAYQPAQANWLDQQLKNFIKGLVDVDPIDQCRFCPDQVTITDGGPTRAYQKKIKIKAI